MTSTAIIVLADTETKESLGRVVNAMKAVEEFKNAGEPIRMYFDGAASKWPSTLSDPDHDYHALYQTIRDQITGVCAYCAEAFGVDEQTKEAGISLLSEKDGHFSYLDLVRSDMKNNHILRQGRKIWTPRQPTRIK